MMSAAQQFVWFAGGTILGNPMFHRICGVDGGAFQMPLANAPGTEFPGSTINVLRGVVNLLAVWLLRHRVGDADSRSVVVADVFEQARLPASARHISGCSRLHGDNAPTELPVTQ